ncbi:MAG TPA: hypothetical protein VD837_04965 [Terriglobales bacterium]|nr:hypothetical protein [Terriglobales bacterium]
MHGLAQIRRLVTLTFVLVATGLGAQAQRQPFEHLNITSTGSLGLGYSRASSDSTAGSTLGFSGSGSLNGSYYHPNFISFNVQPYYNHSKNNAGFDTLFTDKGFDASANFFSGSRLPFYLGFAKQYSAVGQVGLPELGNLTTNGRGQAFTAGGSLLLDQLPTITFAYSRGSNNSTLVGTDEHSEGSSQHLNLGASYKLAGFDLRAFATRQDTENRVPSFFGTGITESSGDGTSYGVSAMHRIPMNGSASASWTRHNYQTLTNDYDSRGTSDNLAAGATFAPFTKLTFSTDFRYTTDLDYALLRETGITPFAGLKSDVDSSSVGVNNFASLTLTKHISINGYLTHQWQNYLDREINLTQYGGNVRFNYARPLFGSLYFSVGLVDTATQEGNQGLGFVTNAGFNKMFGRWDTSADFSYSQQVNTLAAIYTTSSYNFGGGVRRKFNDALWWGFRATESRSGLTTDKGSSNHSESVATNVRWGRYSASGSYSQSAGRSVLTLDGTLTATPAAGLFDREFTLYNGRSYSIGASTTPVPRMTLLAHYSWVKSDTLTPKLYSLNQGTRFTTQFDYKMRKLSLRGGYSRVNQSISAASQRSGMLNSFYIGIYRWFEVF